MNSLFSIKAITRTQTTVIVIIVVVATILGGLVYNYSKLPTLTPKLSLNYRLGTLEDLTKGIIDAHNKVYSDQDNVESEDWNLLSAFCDSEKISDPINRSATVQSLLSDTNTYTQKWKAETQNGYNMTNDAEVEITRIESALGEVRSAIKSGDTQKITEAYQDFNRSFPAHETVRIIGEDTEFGYVLRGLEDSIESFNNNQEKGVNQSIVWCREYEGCLKRIQSIDANEFFNLLVMGKDVQLANEYIDFVKYKDWNWGPHPGLFDLVYVAHDDVVELVKLYNGLMQVSANEKQILGRGEISDTLFKLDSQCRNYLEEIVQNLSTDAKKVIEPLFDQALNNEYFLSWLNTQIRIYKENDSSGELRNYLTNLLEKWYRNPNSHLTVQHLMEMTKITNVGGMPDQDPHFKLDKNLLDVNFTGTALSQYEQAYDYARQLWDSGQIPGGCGGLTSVMLTLMHNNGNDGIYTVDITWMEKEGEKIQGHSISALEIEGKFYFSDPMGNLPPTTIEGKIAHSADILVSVQRQSIIGARPECIFHIGETEGNKTVLRTDIWPVPYYQSP